MRKSVFSWDVSCAKRCVDCAQREKGGVDRARTARSCEPTVAHVGAVVEGAARNSVWCPDFVGWRRRLSSRVTCGRAGFVGCVPTLCALKLCWPDHQA